MPPFVLEVLPELSPREAFPASPRRFPKHNRPSQPLSWAASVHPYRVLPQVVIEPEGERAEGQRAASRGLVLSS
jgi:hypothetical protein